MRARASGSLLAPRYRPRVLEVEDVPSDSQPGVWYAVTRYADGTYSCDCPDYRIRRAPYGEECKHIARVKNRTGWSRVRKAV